jgi:hypothetical protein
MFAHAARTSSFVVNRPFAASASEASRSVASSDVSSGGRSTPAGTGESARDRPAPHRARLRRFNGLFEHAGHAGSLAFSTCGGPPAIFNAIVPKEKPRACARGFAIQARLRSAAKGLRTCRPIQRARCADDRGRYRGSAASRAERRRCHRPNRRQSCCRSACRDIRRAGSSCW